MGSDVHIRNLTVKFDKQQPVVSGVDLDIDAGQVVALVGRSGSGKSTIGRAILGLLPQTGQVVSGSLSVGQTLLELRDREALQGLLGSTLGYVPQDPHQAFDPLRRVGPQAGETLGWGRRGRRERKARIVDAFGEVGLAEPCHVHDSYAHQLSGGMRQRALIAGAVVGKPTLLVADEPTAALDAAVRRGVLEHLVSVARDRSVAVLLITHDLLEARRSADRIAILQAGRVVEAGSTERVWAQPTHAHTQRLLRAAQPVRHPRSDRLPTPSEPLLKLQGVSARYRGATRSAVEDIDLTLSHGETLAVVGESGSGKSTVARLALGMLLPESGTVTVRLRSPGSSGVQSGPRPSLRVQPIFQDAAASLDPRWSVERTLLEAAATRPGAARHRRQQLSDVIGDVLDAVALGHSLLERRPRELSGGQAQRVAIARSLLAEPDLLVCDEPTSALDVLVQDQVLALLDRLQRERNLAYLFISHDLGAVAKLAHRVAVMQEGRVVEQGPASQILTAPGHPYTRRLLDAGVAVQAPADGERPDRSA